ncbi:MAG TPA: formyltransferase family protein [Candidatus Saccharimonadales bacterium]|nr:formyltransferase family protein [Candidatus Saccharimonadales bacterium]
MAKPRIAILASGGGTTAESFINSTITGKISAEVVLVISNVSKAGVIDKVRNINKANNQNIKALHIGKSNYPPKAMETVTPGTQTKAEEEAILQALSDNKVDIVFLLGYMKKVGSKIVSKYGWSKNLNSVFESNMFNTHPGLLPVTKGLFGVKVQAKTLETNQTVAGHCIFAVDDEYDDGPIITEHKVKILDGDTPESLFERVKESEKKYLADDVNYFLKNKYN